LIKGNVFTCVVAVAVAVVVDDIIPAAL